MTLNGTNTSPSNKDMLVGCFTLIFLFVPALCCGIWLQKELLGVFELEERVERLESKLSK